MIEKKSTLNTSIRITEIFYSIQGESTSVGIPTIFIRLTGCPLRCQYCDTAYAFKGGKIMSLDMILSEIQQYQCHHICVTGGEPLAQKGCLLLLKQLCDANYIVSLETSGACDITLVDKRVMIVMDLKTPASLEVSKNKMENIPLLKKTDQIKFVLCNRDDYEWARNVIRTHHLAEKTSLLFSPSAEELSPTLLAEWILNDQLPVRLQIQLHKILWHDAKGR